MIVLEVYYSLWLKSDKVIVENLEVLRKFYNLFLVNLY